MVHFWKAPHIAKGVVSRIQPLYRWRLRTGGTGGTNSPEYCLREWQRQVSQVESAGFVPGGARIVELGPGDTLGVGLAALLSGAASYRGLDIFPFASSCDVLPLLERLLECIPAGSQCLNISEHELYALRRDLANGLRENHRVSYEAPWSPSSVETESVDLVMSHCVLDVILRLEEAFHAMYSWLRPGGVASHWIACNAWFFSPYWNGHWAYSDLEWRLVRGGRAFLPNREPISTYLTLAENVGFEVVTMTPSFGENGLPPAELAPRYQQLGPLDARTRGASVVLRKPV